MTMNSIRIPAVTLLTILEVGIAHAGFLDAISKAAEDTVKGVGDAVTASTSGGIVTSSRKQDVSVSSKQNARIAKFKSEIMPLVEQCNRAIADAEGAGVKDFQGVEEALNGNGSDVVLAFDHSSKRIAFVDDAKLQKSASRAKGTTGCIEFATLKSRTRLESVLRFVENQVARVDKERAETAARVAARKKEQVAEAAQIAKEKEKQAEMAALVADAKKDPASVKVLSPEDAAFETEEAESKKIVEGGLMRVFQTQAKDLIDQYQKILEEVYGIEKSPVQLDNSESKCRAKISVCLRNIKIVDGGLDGEGWRRFLYAKPGELIARDCAYDCIRKMPEGLYWSDRGERVKNAKMQKMIEAEFRCDQVDIPEFSFPVSPVFAQIFVEECKARIELLTKFVHDAQEGQRKGLSDAEAVIAARRYKYACDVVKYSGEQGALDAALSQFAFYKGMSLGKCYSTMRPLCKQIAESGADMKEDAGIDRKSPHGVWPKLRVEISVEKPIPVAGGEKMMLPVSTHELAAKTRTEPDDAIPIAHRVEIREESRILRMAFGRFGDDYVRAPLAVARLDFTGKRPPMVKDILAKYKKLLQGDVRVVKRPLETVSAEDIETFKKAYRKLADENTESGGSDLVFEVSAQASHEIVMSGIAVTCVVCAKGDAEDSEVAAIYFFDKFVYDALVDEKKRIQDEQESRRRQAAEEAVQKEKEKSLDF